MSRHRSRPSSSSATTSPAARCCSTRPRDIIAARRRGASCRRSTRREAAREAGKWLAGYFSYEAGYLFEPKLRPLLPGRPARAADLPRRLRRPAERDLPASRPAGDQRPDLRRAGSWSFEDYEKRFSAAAPASARGRLLPGEPDLSGPRAWSGDPLAAFDALTARQPVKYGALVSLGDPVVLSRSPELFFEIDARGLDRDASDERHRAARQDARRRTGGSRSSCATTRRTRPRTA